MTTSRENVAIASLCVAGFLIVLKLVAFFATESAGVLSSLMDSMLDALAATVTLVGVRQAQRPPSQSYRYGWGKAEALAALAQSAFILGSAVLLCVEVANRLMNPPLIEYERWGIAALVVSSGVVIVLMLVQRRVVHATHSVAIEADYRHYSGDLFINLAVIAGLLLTLWTGYTMFDTLFALLVAIFLVANSRGVARQALKLLLDREIPPDERAALTARILRHPLAKGVHDLRTRDSGTQRFIEFHLELDGTMSLTQSHDIADQIEQMVREAFPHSEILIHQEPAGLNDHRLDQVIAEASET